MRILAPFATLVYMYIAQVASEMLPNSTERTVTVSGGSEAVVQSIYHICCIMSEVIII